MVNRQTTKSMVLIKFYQNENCKEAKETEINLLHISNDNYHWEQVPLVIEYIWKWLNKSKQKKSTINVYILELCIYRYSKEYEIPGYVTNRANI